MAELTIRPIAGRDELDLFCQLSYLLDDELADDLDAGRRLPEWMWVAVRGDRLVARLAWWARDHDDVPRILDVFDVDDAAELDEVTDIGVRLVEAATGQVLGQGGRRPHYSRFVSPDWRDDPAERRAVESRMAMLAQTGAELFVERLRLEWQPAGSVAPPGERLDFRPADDTAELLALMSEVLDGTLDAHSRDDLTRMSAQQAAIEQYDVELSRYRSPRDWWRVATLPGGGPVGFVIPARNDYNAIIAYIGVLPEHRGHGYIDDILAEGTRILAAEGVPRIRASTDLGNVPMARAFQRAGYVNFGREIVMRWP
jgi:RimJ/RimL family protein N-acetyltransferase